VEGESVANIQSSNALGGQKWPLERSYMQNMSLTLNVALQMTLTMVLI
jgi:hypothetical protein